MKTEGLAGEKLGMRVVADAELMAAGRAFGDGETAERLWQEFVPQ